MAVLLGCPPLDPTPAVNLDPPASSSPQNDSSYTCPARRYESIRGVSSLDRNIKLELLLRSSDISGLLRSCKTISTLEDANEPL
jgi:hypothetical protein